MVSRETDIPADELLADLFGARVPQALAYVDLLRCAGVERGLVGPREGPRIWQRHVLNCAAIAPIFGLGARVCDVGTGSGLPGIVLALARPDLSLTLLDPLLRRVTFLRETVAALGVDNAEVIRGRAEELCGTVRYDAVTARAVASLDTLARWCLPLVRVGGEVVALKGSTAAEELRDAHSALRRLGADRVRIETYGGGFVQPPTTVVRIRSGSNRAPGQEDRGVR